MTYQFVGIKEFRQNMAAISDAASKKKHRLIILRKNRPLFELRPINSSDASMDALFKGIEEAETDIRKGRIYSSAQTRKRLGL